ncbi:TetR/AcrR family transcriptional regulator, partial [Nonomuraea wenchangensis]
PGQRQADAGDGAEAVPGGRSARVRAAVHQAVTDLVGEHGYGNFTIGDVAARAGVADTSLYRRWGNLQTLLGDVLLTRLYIRVLRKGQVGLTMSVGPAKIAT